MAKSAKIISSEAVTMLSRALCKLDEHVRRTLDDVDTQVRRAALWFEQDRHFFWKAEMRRSFDHISEARVALEQARAKKVGDHQPSCYVERKALARAKARSEETQRRVKELRGAISGLRRAISEYQGTMVRLRSWFDSDLPKALAALERMHDALEAYAGTASSPPDAAFSRELAAIATASPAPDAQSSPKEQPEEQPGEPPEAQPEEPAGTNEAEHYANEWSE